MGSASHIGCWLFVRPRVRRWAYKGNELSELRELNMFYQGNAHQHTLLHTVKLPNRISRVNKIERGREKRAVHDELLKKGCLKR